MGIIEHGLRSRECMRHEPQPSALSNSRDHKPSSYLLYTSVNGTLTDLYHDEPVLRTMS